MGGRPGLVVSEETDRLLRDALTLAEATGGAFNPLVGPLVAAWDVRAMRAAFVAGAPLPPAPSVSCRRGGGACLVVVLVIARRREAVGAAQR